MAMETAPGTNPEKPPRDILSRIQGVELDPVARNYAENLHEQLLTSLGNIGVKDFEDFLGKAKARAIPIDRVEEVSTLLGQISRIIESREAPFDYEEFFGNVRELTNRWCDFHRSEEFESVRDPSERLEAEVEFVSKEIGLLGEMPILAMIADRSLVQKLILVSNEVGKNKEDPYFRKNGVLVSEIYNRFLHLCSDASLINKVHQLVDVDETQGVNFLGLNLCGGVLEVKAGRRDFLGFGMSGGSILAEEVGQFAGFEMAGGLLKVDRAGAWLGCQMKGGLIQVKQAGGAVGSYMEGGKIIIEEQYQSLGDTGTGGEIYFQGEKIA